MIFLFSLKVWRMKPYIVYIKKHCVHSLLQPIKFAAVLQQVLFKRKWTVVSFLVVSPSPTFLRRFQDFAIGAMRHACKLFVGFANTTQITRLQLCRDYDVFNAAAAAAAAPAAADADAADVATWSDRPRAGHAASMRNNRMRDFDCQLFNYRTIGLTCVRPTTNINRQRHIRLQVFCRRCSGRLDCMIYIYIVSTAITVLRVRCWTVDTVHSSRSVLFHRLHQTVWSDDRLTADSTDISKTLCCFYANIYLAAVAFAPLWQRWRLLIRQ